MIGLFCRGTNLLLNEVALRIFNGKNGHHFTAFSLIGKVI